MGIENDLMTRIHPDYPFLKAEIKWSVDHELVEHVDDFLYRRIRLGLIDVNAIESIKDETINYFGELKLWDSNRKAMELDRLKGHTKMTI